jgi:enediyne biosynthesis protein E4
MLDLVEVNRMDNVRVWRNVGAGTAEVPTPTGSWLAVDVRQPAPNVNAIGAWVDVRTPNGVQRQQRVVGGGHAGGELGWLHWGLGSADAAEVRVTWPDGEQTDWQAADADTFVVVDRAQGGLEVVEPAA